MRNAKRCGPHNALIVHMRNSTPSDFKTNKGTQKKIYRNSVNKLKEVFQF